MKTPANNCLPLGADALTRGFLAAALPARGLGVILGALVLSYGVNAQTFTTLHSFTGTDGASPYATLVSSGSRLYGTTYSGGIANNGTVFAINTDGTAFTNLHSFTTATGAFPFATNSDGVYPNGLLLSGDVLYGTAQGGGDFARGAVFALKTDGTEFTTLHSFTPRVSGTNSDGACQVGVNGQQPVWGGRARRAVWQWHDFQNQPRRR